jgi:hypothetical protein
MRPAPPLRSQWASLSSLALAFAINAQAGAPWPEVFVMPKLALVGQGRTPFQCLSLNFRAVCV